MIIDVICANPDCLLRRDDVLLKAMAPLPLCEKCLSPTQRIWSIRRHGPNGNQSSLLLQFNYLE
jgi:hypothetical protein